MRDLPHVGTAANLLGSGLFVFVVTYALLVPDRPIWTVLVGGSESGFFLGIFVACVVFGALFVACTGVPVTQFVVGGFGAYALWLWYLEAFLGPFDSPVHILLGVVYLVGFGTGGAIVERALLSGIVPRRLGSG